MLTVDIHTHTVASGHGTQDTIADMAKEAASRGIQILGISDHGPRTFCAGTPSYFRSLKFAQRQRFGVQMLYGIELNILDGGSLDLEDSILKELDYSIASMHKPPRRITTLEENTADYIKAMQNPYVRIIGHPDNTQFPVDYWRLVEAAAQYHMIFELNEASLKPGGYHQVAGTSTKENYMNLLSLCLPHRIPILLSSDTHGRQGLGKVDACEAIIREAGYPEELIVNNHMELLYKGKK